MDPTSNIDLILNQNSGGRPIIGCFPLYPPLELFSSMGLYPFVMWNLKSSIGDLTESDKHIQSYACAIARELVQYVLSGSFSNPDGIFFYNACDTLRNTPEILKSPGSASGSDMAMLQMHLPQVNRFQTNADDYLKNEIEELIIATEKAFNVKFDPCRFEQTVLQYSDLREYCQQAETKVAEGALSFESFAEVVMANYLLPPELQIEKLIDLIRQSKSGSFRKSPGVVVSGIMPPPGKVIRAIEASGLRIVSNDIAALKRSYAYNPKPTGDPGTYYTDLYNNRFPCTTLLYKSDQRLDMFLDLVETSEASGVIFCGEKYCEYEYFEFPHLEKRLKEKGVAILNMEFSIDDVDNIGAYITRIEAFAELLNS